MARYLMLDVDGVLVTGRPSDGRSWYAELQNDLGIDIEWLRSAFFKVFGLRFLSAVWICCPPFKLA